MDHFDFIHVTCERHVMTITINRPEVLNALHSPAHFELARAFDGYAADRMLASDDAKEGQRAFVEKRKPIWKGR